MDDSRERRTENTPRVRSNRKLWINITIGVLFSAFFVWLVVRGVDWDRFSQAFKTMEPVWLLVYFVVLSVSHLLRLFRWGISIKPIADIAWPRIMAVGAVGMMAIFSLPARLGEFVRPLLIIEDEGINFGEATATVVVERLIDGLTMSVVLFVTVMMLDPAIVPENFIISGYVAAAVFGSASLGLLVSGLTFRWIRAPLHRLLSFFSSQLADKITAMIEGFFKALKLLGTLRLAVTYLLTTLAIWALAGLGLFLLFRAFPGATDTLPLIAAFTVLSVLVVGIMIPAGPGTVGVFHWAIIFALAMFSVDESTGLLVATSVHLLIAAVNFVWGVVGWVAGRIEFTAVLRRKPPTLEEGA